MSVQNYIENLQFSVFRFDWKWLSFKDMIWRHENYSEKIRQVELFNFEDIQNYYTAKLFRQSSRKNNSSVTVLHSWN